MSKPNNIHELPTPALLVESSALQRNLDAMANACATRSVRLRPHAKTHKCIELASMQLEGGAIGLTCAKVSEARVFAEAGIQDIRIAYPLVGEKAAALRDLAQSTGVRVSTIVDSAAGLEGLSSAWSDGPYPLPVLVDIDVGFRRTGIPFEQVDEIATFVERISAAPPLAFAGILTHAGHSYGAASIEEVRAIGEAEGVRMGELAGALRSRGFEVPEVSVGSTPSAMTAVQQAGVTELRPGNYVFYDAIQCGLGVASPSQCSLRVLTSVVSRPSESRAFCDAGAKTFSSDRVTRGEREGDFGAVLDANDGTLAEARLVKLSEEHGWLRSESGAAPRVGDRLQILPAHACVCVNLSRDLWLVDGERVLDRWDVAARARRE